MNKTRQQPRQISSARNARVWTMLPPQKKQGENPWQALREQEASKPSCEAVSDRTEGVRRAQRGHSDRTGPALAGS